MKIPLLFLFLLTGACRLSAQNLYDSTNSRQFSDYLIRTQQYPLAIIELERLVFLQPSNTAIQRSLIRSYSLNKDYKGALNRLQVFSPNTNLLDSSLSYYYAYNLIASKEFKPATDFLSSSGTLSAEKKLYFKTWTALFQNDFKTAEVLISNPDAQTPLFSPLKPIVAEGLTIRRKSPGLATIMSAVVPGSGKWYAGEKKDAIISFLTVGIMAYQSFRGFNRHGINSTYGWIYGGLGAGFYLGNLYGSNHSAKRYNKRKLIKIDSKIEDAFYLHP